MTAHQTELFTDAYDDLYKGFGNPLTDTSMGQTIRYKPILSDAYLATLWRGDSLAKKCVKAAVNDAIRAGITIEGTDNQDAISALAKRNKELKLLPTLKEMGWWARHYGGAICCIGYRDGAQKVSDPVTGKNPEIDFLKVYPRSAIEPMTMDIVRDPKSPRYGQPERYTVQTQNAGTVKWHYTRVVEMKGEPMPDDSYTADQADTDARYWGFSIHQGATEHLSNLGISLQGVAALLKEANIGKFTMHGLATALASGKGDMVLNRLRMMAAGKSILNAVVLDAGGPGLVAGGDMPAETFAQEAASLSGIPEILQEMKSIVAGLYYTPESRLFGMQSKGLGGTDEGSMRNYHEYVIDLQENLLHDPAMELITRINAAMGTPVPADTLDIEWSNPAEPTLAEEIKMYREQADADAVYMDKGVLDPQEVRENRFVGEKNRFGAIEVEGDISPVPNEPPPPPEDKAKKTNRKGTK